MLPMQETPYGAGGTKIPQGSSSMVARVPGTLMGLLARCDQRPRRTKREEKNLPRVCPRDFRGWLTPGGPRQFPTNQFGELMSRLCWPMEKGGIETHHLGMRLEGSYGSEGLLTGSASLSFIY